MCTCVSVYIGHWMGIHGSPEDVGFQEAGVTGDCEPPNVASGIQTRINWESSKHA